MTEWKSFLLRIFNYPTINFLLYILLIAIVIFLIILIIN